MGNPTSTREFQSKVVRHCAPVLAGIKPAGMFSCPLKSAHCCGSPTCKSLKPLDFLLAYEDCSVKLASLGVRLAILDQREKSMLVLVYREEQLAATIAEAEAAAFLKSLGYDTGNLEASLSKLTQRISYASLVARTKNSCAFPHEVGIFLGYPVEDVIGFIENQGDNYLVCGCWKAYTRERDAHECFCRYKECTANLTERFQAGARLEDLATVERKVA